MKLLRYLSSVPRTACLNLKYEHSYTHVSCKDGTKWTTTNQNCFSIKRFFRYLLVHWVNIKRTPSTDFVPKKQWQPEDAYPCPTVDWSPVDRFIEKTAVSGYNTPTLLPLGILRTFGSEVLCLERMEDCIIIIFVSL